MADEGQRWGEWDNGGEEVEEKAYGNNLSLELMIYERCWCYDEILAWE
jgi:hypothetical protein